MTVPSAPIATRKILLLLLSITFSFRTSNEQVRSTIAHSLFFFQHQYGHEFSKTSWILQYFFISELLGSHICCKIFSLFPLQLCYAFRLYSLSGPIFLHSETKLLSHHTFCAPHLLLSMYNLSYIYCSHHFFLGCQKKCLSFPY